MQDTDMNLVCHVFTVPFLEVPGIYTSKQTYQSVNT